MATPPKRKLTTNQAGLGHRHRQAVDGLFDALPPIGDAKNPCAVCKRPRHKDRTKNYDYKANSNNPTNGKLQGDHSKMSRRECIERGLPIPLPDRLVHGECNRLRGEGLNDHLFTDTVVANQELYMPWPA